MFNSKISTLNFLIGFILAGVGVDDMIVVEQFHSNAKKSGKGNVLQRTMADAGLAVFLTSLTAVVAFLVGAFVDLPAVRSFCVCSGLAFGYNFVLNVTFFPAFLLLDERRCGMICCASRAKEEKVAEEALKAKECPPDAVAAPSFAEDAFSKVITPFLSNERNQIVIFVVVVLAAILDLVYGLGITVGMGITEVVPDDSYAVDVS